MFINLYYTEIGALNTQIGIAFAVQSICELPFLFFGALLIEKYGVKRIIIFTLLVAALRMFLYGLTTNPWIAIAIGCTHGITLGLFSCSCN
jgi:PPP family 3-phenylpropionic acid transporter